MLAFVGRRIVNRLTIVLKSQISVSVLRTLNCLNRNGRFDVGRKLVGNFRPFVIAGALKNRMASFRNDAERSRAEEEGGTIRSVVLFSA